MLLIQTGGLGLAWLISGLKIDRARDSNIRWSTSGPSGQVEETGVEVSGRNDSDVFGYLRSRLLSRLYFEPCTGRPGTMPILAHQWHWGPPTPVQFADRVNKA